MLAEIGTTAVAVKDAAAKAEEGWKLWQRVRNLRWQTASRWFLKRYSLGVLANLHEGLVHRLRTLEYCATLDHEQHTVQAQIIARDICGALNKAMAEVLCLKPEDLHCSIKLMRPDPADATQHRVVTYSRSEPFDARGGQVGEATSKLLNGHSAWCACLGLGASDGNNLWNVPYCCFVCNDLKNVGAAFACTRQGWQDYYNSMLVFPMRRAADASGNTLDHVGFLTFDSLKTDIFYGAPRTFDRTNASEYRKVMATLAYFHVGAMAADLLAFAFYNIARPGNQTPPLTSPAPVSV